MEPTTTEQVLREAFARGENEQRSLLAEAIQQRFEENDDYDHWGLLSDSYQIRSNMQLYLIGCQASGDPADGSKGHCHSQFLEYVHRMYENERARYKQTTLYTSLLKHHINPERGTYESLEQSPCLDFNATVRDAYKWNDEELIEWLGRYVYMASSAHDDLRLLVDELYHVERPVQPANITSPGGTALSELEQEDIETGSETNQYSTRSATIVLLSILEGLQEGSTVGVNVSAMARLLSRLNGKNEDNHEKHIKKWRDLTLTAQVDELKALISDLKALKLDLDCKRIEEMIEAQLKG